MGTNESPNVPRVTMNASGGSYRTKLCNAVNLLTCLSVIPVAFCVAASLGSLAYVNAKSVCVYVGWNLDFWMEPSHCGYQDVSPQKFYQIRKHLATECFSLFGYQSCLPQPGLCASLIVTTPVLALYNFIRELLCSGSPCAALSAARKAIVSEVKTIVQHCGALLWWPARWCSMSAQDWMVSTTQGIATLQGYVIQYGVIGRLIYQTVGLSVWKVLMNIKLDTTVLLADGNLVGLATVLLHIILVSQLMSVSVNLCLHR